jgi:nucleotide-binding universal stress UspA family protein
MSAQPIKRVVVATDFSDGSERALTVAIRFANLLGATVDLVHVYPMPAAGVMSPIPGVVPMPPPPPEVLEEIERRLESQAGRVRDAGADCLFSTMQGMAADEIVAYANRTAAELIVMGTHGRTGLRRVLLGSVAEQVLHKARCPVLVVPPARETIT